jgi:hypothetical protein
MRLLRAEVNRQIKDTVRRLCRVLLQMPKAAAEQDSQVWLDFRRWVLLGRALLLGNDALNGVIALERCGVKMPGGRIFRSEVLCQLCGSLASGIHPFAKEVKEMASARYAPRNTGGDSEVQHPRSLYVDIPENCVG